MEPLLTTNLLFKCHRHFLPEQKLVCEIHISKHCSTLFGQMWCVFLLKTLAMWPKFFLQSNLYPKGPVWQKEILISKVIFHLENINIFQVVVVGRFHSITPSLLHFLLDIWIPGGQLPNEKVRDAGWKI